MKGGWGFPKLGIPFLGGTHYEDYDILKSILGPYFAKEIRLGNQAL